MKKQKTDKNTLSVLFSGKITLLSKQYSLDNINEANIISMIEGK